MIPEAEKMSIREKGKESSNFILFVNWFTLLTSSLKGKMQCQELSQFSEIPLLHFAGRKLSPLPLNCQFLMSFALLKWWSEFRPYVNWIKLHEKRQPIAPSKTNWEKSLSSMAVNMTISKNCRSL